MAGTEQFQNAVRSPGAGGIIGEVTRCHGLSCFDHQHRTLNLCFLRKNRLILLALICKSLIINGEGEGNRTLVSGFGNPSFGWPCKLYFTSKCRDRSLHGYYSIGAARPKGAAGPLSKAICSSPNRPAKTLGPSSTLDMTAPKLGLATPTIKADRPFSLRKI